MARTFDASAPDFDARFRRFLREPRATGHDVAGIVGKILDEVEERGGEAVATHTAKFDELQIDPVTLTSDNVNLAELAAQCPDDLKQAIDFAHDRIAAYHRAQMPQELQQFTIANPPNPLVRLEPINSVRRIAEDHIGSSGGSTSA